MKTLARKTNRTVNLVTELKEQSKQAVLKDDYEKIKKLEENYFLFKEKLDNIDKDRIQKLENYGFRMYEKEKKIVSDYETIKNRIVQKENDIKENTDFFNIIPEVIYDLGAKYDLKFLPLSEYNGQVDDRLLDRISEFEKTPKYHKDYITYYILAPTEMFNKHNITIINEIFVDPVVVAIYNNNKELDMDYSYNRINSIEYLKNYIKNITKKDIRKNDLEGYLNKQKQVLDNSNMFFIHKWGDDFTVKREYMVKLEKFAKNFNIVTKITGGMNLFLLFTLLCFKVLDVDNSSYKPLYAYLFLFLIAMAISLVVDGFRNMDKPQKSDNQKRIDVIIPNLNTTSKDIYTNRF